MAKKSKTQRLQDVTEKVPVWENPDGSIVEIPSEITEYLGKFWRRSFSFTSNGFCFPIKKEAKDTQPPSGWEIVESGPFGSLILRKKSGGLTTVFRRKA